MTILQSKKAIAQTIMATNPQIWTVSAILSNNFGDILLLDDERACLHVSDFYYIEGPFLESFGNKLLNHFTGSAIITSSNYEWYHYIAKKIGHPSQQVLRQMFSWNAKNDKLASYVGKQLKPGYRIKAIDKSVAEQIQNLTWADDVFDSYLGITGFLKQGFGYCIVNGEKIISLCMSFSHSHYGVEIEIDTDPLYQNQGLGKIIAAYFIAEALKRHLTPLWDATNPPSAKIAQALGFTLMREYEALYL